MFCLTHGIRIGARALMSVMLSTPPPMAASAPSCMIWCAAMAMACRPDEQKRFTVVAGDRDRQAGQQRRHAARRSCLACLRLAAAQDHVFDLGRIELRRLAQNVA